MLFFTFEFNGVDINTPTVNFKQVRTFIDLEGEQDIKNVWIPKEMYAVVHGEKHIHKGVCRTCLMANTHFTGHSMRYNNIEDMISKCKICLKQILRIVDCLVGYVLLDLAFCTPLAVFLNF